MEPERREPPARPARTHTPMEFTSQQEVEWEKCCTQLDELNGRLAPMMEESAKRHPCIGILPTLQLLGKPAYQDLMNTRRGSLRMLLETKENGGEYTVELLGAHLKNLKSIPDYIRRITEGLASEEAFLAQRNQILAGLEELQDIGTKMQEIAQTALNNFAASEAGKTHAGTAALKHLLEPRNALGG